MILARRLVVVMHCMVMIRTTATTCAATWCKSEHRSELCSTTRVSSTQLRR